MVPPSTCTSSRGRTSQDQDPTRLHASRFLRPVFSPQFQSSSFNLTPPRLFVSAIPLAPSPSFCSFSPRYIRGGRLGSILIHHRTDYVHRLASPYLPAVIPPNYHRVGPTLLLVTLFPTSGHSPGLINKDSPTDTDLDATFFSPPFQDYHLDFYLCSSSRPRANCPRHGCL